MPHPIVLALSAPAWISLVSVLAAAILALTWRLRLRPGAPLLAYILVTTGLALVGVILWQLTRRTDFNIEILYVVSMLTLMFAGIAVFLGFVEFGIMRVLGLSRLGAIARITYYEALLQPFTLLILVCGLCAMGVCARLEYFTYDEDFKMFRDVASSFVFLFSLPIMVFASTKVIDEEIENRTMLTLMSKPVSRTQVVLGKYVGVLTLVFVCVAILGAMAVVSSYLRYYDDKSIDYRLVVGNVKETADLEFINLKALLALLPSIVLTFLQDATLAAVSVAISTRFGLAVNVTAIVLIYLAASLARYLGDAPELSPAVQWSIKVLAYFLPGLGELDLNQRLIFGDYCLGKADAAAGQPMYAQIWQYVGLAAVYCVFYISAALAFGVALFRTRELT